MNFDGKTFNSTLDGERLATQFERVKELMLDGKWWDLPSLAHAVDGSEAGVSARIRDMRKEKFGGFIVDRRRDPAYAHSGRWQYRLRMPIQFDHTGQGSFV